VCLPSIALPRTSIRAQCPRPLTAGHSSIPQRLSLSLFCGKKKNNTASPSLSRGGGKYRAISVFPGGVPASAPPRSYADSVFPYGRAAPPRRPRRAPLQGSARPLRHQVRPPLGRPFQLCQASMWGTAAGTPPPGALPTPPSAPSRSWDPMRSQRPPLGWYPMGEVHGHHLHAHVSTPWPRSVQTRVIRDYPF